jgi:hypothetical protein
MNDPTGLRKQLSEIQHPSQTNDVALEAIQRLECALAWIDSYIPQSSEHAREINRVRKTLIGSIFLPIEST